MRRRCLIPIDPLAITWRQSKRHRGRRLSITCKIPTRGQAEKIILRVSPKVAQELLADLENPRFFDYRQSPHPIHRSLIGTTLGQVRPGLTRQVVTQFANDESWKLSVTGHGAALLQDDLEGWALSARENPTAIRNSVVGEFLERAVGSLRTRRQYSLEILKEALEFYGPWIRDYVERVTDNRRCSPRAKDLLKHLLAKATEAGYPHERFYSKRSPSRLLKRPLRAWLIEFCLGYWVGLAKRTPPMELTDREIRTQRGAPYGDKPGSTPLFKRYLGPTWKARLAKTQGKVPHPIAQLLGQ